jgi:PHS family inorganic phosphate transporter-like MFS transporter
MSATLRVVVSGAGFIADAYDLFVINVVKNILKQLYSGPTYGDLDLRIASIANAALIGAVLGQLFFGLAADALGRRVIFISTAVLVILGSLVSALCTDLPGFDVYSQLMLCRGLLGFGIGGEYPLSATVSSEGTTTAQRGRAVAAVFSMQGIGNVLASVVVLICLKSGVPLDLAWRLSLGAGALPGLCTVYFRVKLEESEHYKNLSAAVAAVEAVEGPAAEQEEAEAGGKPSTPAAPPPPSAGSAAAAASAAQQTLATIAAHKWTLLGTAGSWLIFDILFYGNSLFSSDISSVLPLQGESNKLAQQAESSAILALIGLPGYFLAWLLIDRMGRRNMQLMGFAVIAVLYAALAGGLTSIKRSPAGFLLLYGLTYLFSNFGPNTSTFVIPAECFPTAAKATCHGISAASGKVGAAIGATAFPFLVHAFGPLNSGDTYDRGVALTLGICSALSVGGLIFSYFLTVESGRMSIAELDAAEAARRAQAAAPSDSLAKRSSDRSAESETLALLSVRAT